MMLSPAVCTKTTMARSRVAGAGNYKTTISERWAKAKNKMLVLYAVRNKLIHRIYAVVKRGKKYDKKYVSPLA